VSTTPEYQLLTIKTIIAPLSSKNGTFAGKISPITNFTILGKYLPPVNPPSGGQEEKKSFSLD